ncbi:hypothetical protein Hypma_009707 [Hypsizygus marmoreus]|uniref:Uncharacterized protein n=1 Tax=Hypsizygus marmoreus TaxID=39966 RepID=A0A369JRL7_HYPMA|nr:hypothetical protein Hypma_009707 [Hypsizygus marmoreus]
MVQNSKKNKKYYAHHQTDLQKKSLQRWSRRKELMTDEELEEHRRRHREAAARYRALNRITLRVNAWEYRRKRKVANAAQVAAEEEARMMAAMEAMD